MKSDAQSDIVVASGTLIVGGVTVVGASKSSSTGPILAFAGSLIVALITLIATNRRQRRQLAHASNESQADQKHNSDLKQLELEHDRSLRDKEDLRRFLDEMASAFETANAAFLDLRVDFDRILKIAGETTSSQGEEAKRIEDFRAAHVAAIDTVDTAQEARAAMSIAARRLDIRTSSETGVQKAFWASHDHFSNALSEVFQIECYVKGSTGPPRKEDLIALDRLKSECKAAMSSWGAFTFASQDLVKSTLSHSENAAAIMKEWSKDHAAAASATA